MQQLWILMSGLPEMLQLLTMRAGLLEMLQLLTILWMAWEDLHSGTIRSRQVRILALLCILEGILAGEHGWNGLFAGAPGLVLGICGYLHPEFLGVGDILVAVSLGFTLDPLRVTAWAVDSIVLAGGIGLCMLLDRRQRKEKMPWMPCAGVAALHPMMMCIIEEVLR